jgi:hypothetical protein
LVKEPAFMELKYFYLILCLFASLTVVGQSKRSSTQLSLLDKTDTAVVPAPPEFDFRTVDSGYATGFCNSLIQLLKDATINFERIRGKYIETNNDGIRWTTTGGLPNTVTSCLIDMKVWQYEAVVYLGNSKEDMSIIFSKYSKLLYNCMLANAYIAKSLEKNALAKLRFYPDIKYEKPKIAANGQLPYVTMKVDYAELTDTYTITISVWNK